MNPNGAVIHALAGLLTASYAEDLAEREADSMRAAAVAARDEHDAMRADNDRAKELLARAHGVLEGIPDLRSLPGEIACFLGWESAESSRKDGEP